MCLSRVLWCGCCFLLAGVICWAETGAPVAVSPGDPAGALIADACPTFTWGAVAGPKTYELMVYRLNGEEPEIALSERIPGSALAWTPSLDRCLERGGRYAWSVRALGREGGSEWSSPTFFEVVVGPSHAEFVEALRVVREYLASQAAPNVEGTTASGGVERESSRARQRSVSSPGRSAPAATQLSVDGGIEAASFTGDGSGLTGVTPSGAAGGDLAGSYPNPSLAPEVVTSAHILDHTITGADIGNGTITGLDIAIGSIASVDIEDGTISSVDIGDDTVTGTDIADATITGTDIHDQSITGLDIAPGSIRSVDIEDHTITGTDIADGTITGLDIAIGSIGSVDIEDGGIMGTDIADGTITGLDIDDGTITGADIHDQSITELDMSYGCGTYMHAGYIPGPYGGDYYCPFEGSAWGETGPPCDQVPTGSFCESDGECGLDNSLDNCRDGDWYLRID